MDFLMNAAKIAQEVQGGKKNDKKDKKEGEGSGGFGDLIGGFMGGSDKPKRNEDDYDDERPNKPKPKPKPRRDEDEYDDERPHGSKYDDEKPQKGQSSSSDHRKKPSTGELFSSAQVSRCLAWNLLF